MTKKVFSRKLWIKTFVELGWVSDSWKQDVLLRSTSTLDKCEGKTKEELEKIGLGYMCNDKCFEDAPIKEVKI